MQRPTPVLNKCKIQCHLQVINLLTSGHMIENLKVQIKTRTYVSIQAETNNTRWKHILPGFLHCKKHTKYFLQFSLASTLCTLCCHSFDHLLHSKPVRQALQGLPHRQGCGRGILSLSLIRCNIFMFVRNPPAFTAYSWMMRSWVYYCRFARGRLTPLQRRVIHLWPVWPGWFHCRVCIKHLCFFT